MKASKRVHTGTEEFKNKNVFSRFMCFFLNKEGCYEYFCFKEVQILIQEILTGHCLQWWLLWDSQCY